MRVRLICLSHRMGSAVNRWEADLSFVFWVSSFSDAHSSKLGRRMNRYQTDGEQHS